MWSSSAFRGNNITKFDKSHLLVAFVSSSDSDRKLLPQEFENIGVPKQTELEPDCGLAETNGGSQKDGRLNSAVITIHVEPVKVTTAPMNHIERVSTRQLAKSGGPTALKISLDSPPPTRQETDTPFPKVPQRHANQTRHARFSPVMASLLLRPKSGKHETFLVRWLNRLYLPLLRAALARPILTVVLATLALASTAALVPFLGGEFMPKLEEGNLWARVSMPNTISFSYANQLVDQMRGLPRRPSCC